MEKQEFSWVSVAETWKCKPRGNIFAFTLYPFGKNTSLLIPCRRTSVSPLCPHPVWGMFMPTLSGYILCWLFPCSSSLPSPPFLLFSDTGAAACMAPPSDSLAGGARFLSRIWSERQAAGRRVFFLFFF